MTWTKDHSRQLALWEGLRSIDRTEAALMVGLGLAFSLTAWALVLMGQTEGAFYYAGAILSAGIAGVCGSRAVRLVCAARELSRAIKSLREDTRA